MPAAECKEPGSRCQPDAIQHPQRCNILVDAAPAAGACVWPELIAFNVVLFDLVKAWLYCQALSTLAVTSSACACQAR